MKQANRLFQVVSLTAMLLVLSSMAAWAQSFAIKGNVTDESGEPLIGATVVMKGNAHVAAVTDFDGNFTLQAPQRHITIVEIGRASCRERVFRAV